MAKRITQLDLLRSLAMFFVVAVHTVPYLKPVHGFDIGYVAGEMFLICDPVFFTLSGYFAIRQPKVPYADYLWKKFLTVSLPILLYGVLLYFYVVYQGKEAFSCGSFMRWYHSLIVGEWWFVGALIPFLMLAPWLYEMFESLGAKRQRALFLLIAAVMTWGIAVTCISSFAAAVRWTGAAAAADTLALLIPTRIIPGGYFVYFCLGYFVKRLPELFSEKILRRLCLIGFALWPIGAVSSVFGYKRADPSYLWFFITVAVFIFFGRLRFSCPAAGRIVSFVAQRSYSIYLFNYVSVETVFAMLQAHGLLTDGNPMPFAVRLPLWAAGVVGAYCLALALSCICDYMFLKPLQALLGKIKPSAREKRVHAKYLLTAERPKETANGSCG